MSTQQSRPARSGAAKQVTAATGYSVTHAGDVTPVTRRDARDARDADAFAATYAAALLWVAWTARRRWPDHPANDQVWAASVASWWTGPGAVPRG